MLLGEDGGAVTSASKRRFCILATPLLTAFEKTKGFIDKDLFPTVLIHPYHLYISIMTSIVTNLASKHAKKLISGHAQQVSSLRLRMAKAATFASH